jgi:hypothetical protein
MRANPRDWRIGSLEAVAAAYGVNVGFRASLSPRQFRAPARRPIKAGLVAFIEAVRSEP